MSEIKIKYPILVSWIKWDRTDADWRPIYKQRRCKNEDKAKKLKRNLLKQSPCFLDVTIFKILE